MRYKFLLFLLASTVLLSCKKEKDAGSLPPPLPPASPVLLKEIVIPNLPSPYYHFEYNPSGKVVAASFASGLQIYNIQYNSERISEMRNNIIVNKDRLIYFYDNSGKVNSVSFADSTGEVFRKIHLTYQGKQLIKLEREFKSGPAFTIDRILSFVYHADGNLSELTYHYLPTNNQSEIRYTDRFEQYDNKINVDGFSLIHNEFFEHKVLLPEVQLQKNNPAKVSRFGDGVNYSVDYTYSFNNKNLPLQKSGDLVFQNGPDAGKHFNTNSAFTYY
jgi:hypothetical protein